MFGGLSFSEFTSLAGVAGALLATPVLASRVASRKGRNSYTWGFTALFFNVLAWIGYSVGNVLLFWAGLFFNAMILVAAFLSPPRVGTGLYVACPQCAEPILTEAVKCKHCGSSLTAPELRIPG
jgi:apolipoprotein N-acyltransferase